MKRTTSKNGSLKPEDGTQQKISSFFQPGPAQAPPSKLFTSVSAKSKPPLSLKRQASSSKSNTASTNDSEQKRHSESTGKKTMTVLKDFNSATTPPKSADFSGDHGSADVIVIPDTPENKAQKSWPKPVSRSFLCPASQLSAAPWKKPSPPKTKQRKAVKKTLGPVSVEFGQRRLSEDGKVESKPAEVSVGSTSGCFADAPLEFHSETNSGTGEMVSEKNTDGFNADCVATNSDSSKPVEHGFDSSRDIASIQSVTPTKSSSDRSTVKRMASQGLSPDPKRLLVDETEINNDDAQSSKATTSRCTVKAKRQLATLTGFKDVKDMNRTVNHYQLGGSTKSTAKGDSCTNDDVLADILGEIADKTATRNFSEKKTCSTDAPKPFKPTMTNASLKESPSTKEEPTVDTSEDDVLKEILGELDAKLCQSQNKATSQCKTKESRDKASTATSTNKKESRPKDSLNTNASYPVSNRGASLSSETGRQMQDESEPKHTCSLGNHDANSLRSASNRQQTRDTPTKTRREPAGSAQVKDPVNNELASSFVHLSPFKNKSESDALQEQQESSHKFTDKWNRYVVRCVTVDSTHDKVLELSKEGTVTTTQTARLQGFWSDTHVEPGDIVHLLLEDEGHISGGSNDSGSDASTIIISDSQGQIVVNPDLLLSGTTIVSGVYCLRRSILNEKFKGVDTKNVHMLYGSIIHSLFQEVLKDRLTKTGEIMTAAKSIVQSNKFLHDMYGQSVTEGKVMEEIESYVDPLQTWIHKHVPCVSQNIADRAPGHVSVVQIHDIEETIWSPRIGVKGKIDMTVEVEIHNAGGRKRKVLPLELKTGKASYSVEHKGQVTLYSMMMSDRRQNPEEGLLLYLKHNDMNSVPVKPENTRGLLQLRNEMAYYLSRQAEVSQDIEGDNPSPRHHRLGSLPSPINSHRSCSKCPQLINCAVYQRKVENLQHAPDHAMSSLVPETLAHLSESHLEYFRHWVLCMDLETSAQRAQGLRNIWCMSSAEREMQGDCLQQLVMVHSTLGVPETQGFTEGKGCCVQFQRKPGFSGGALSMSGLSRNDAVVVSSEDGRYIALSTGFIRTITDSVVDIVVDRDSFHENAAFQSLVFRVDRCDVFNTAGYLLTNLSRLLEPSPHCLKLRSLIVDRRKPEFQLTMSKSAVEKVKKIFRPLNKPQKTAILKVLMSKDYVLIKGYPGTGKTSTIVALVKILRELGQSVLLTSYTHSAVDNILLKLKKDRVPFLRLGRCSRIHPQIQDHAAETLTLDITSVEELRDFYGSYGIVATSCLGTNHPMFSQRRFDVCIVDEASQVLQPACLGPLFHAQRFVLVGDPLQLPPVVQSKDAGSLGMGESLFVRLDGAGATYDLHLQYRMNGTIMRLSNELVYKGALTCGDEAVSKACIHLHRLDVGDDADWLCRAMDPSLPNAVVFLDTCQMSAPESSDAKGLTNDTEASLILHLCTAFVQAGILAEDIGVIAPYRAQVRSLQQRLSECFPLKGVEVNTVDQYQGRDKSVVFISFVRSSAHVESDSSHRGGLLGDVRRLNVAVTRAKHKLVLVGNSSTLRRYKPVGTLIDNLRTRDQMFTLPADLHLEEPMDL